MYVRDPGGGYGYGVRPDEPFFSASVIKVPIMIAVYRRMDEGAFSLSDSFETETGGLGGRGRMVAVGGGRDLPHRRGLPVHDDDLQMDNVATNALTRIVGGPEYVNQVARFWSYRHGALPGGNQRAGRRAGPDNRTTLPDMTTMMEQVATRDGREP